jgi:NTP pyrophosphatase (non-canonical NTP hydrolase)
MTLWSAVVLARWTSGSEFTGDLSRYDDPEFTNQMDANTYQTGALQTAIYPNMSNNFIYPTLGLVGEAGEVAEKAKKIIRDGDGTLTEETRKKMALELSDVCWYVAVLAYELDYTLEEIMQMNLDKLASRQQRGVLSGSGDNR